jgi:hypothetical protein
LQNLGRRIYEVGKKTRTNFIYLFLFIYLLALDHPDAGWTESDGDKEDLANGVVSLLVDKKDMLDDYFSIQIDDQGQMLGIPMLLEG